MRKVLLWSLLPVAILAAPFLGLALWRLLERGYTALFIALSITGEYELMNGPDWMACWSMVFAALVAVPVGFEVHDAWRAHAEQHNWLRRQEEQIRWRIERKLERQYADAMRDFVARQELTPLPSNRAPVVVEQ